VTPALRGPPVAARSTGAQGPATSMRSAGAPVPARGWAGVDASGRHQSEGRRLLRRATAWDRGAGRRDSLDALCAQIRATGLEVAPQSISDLINGRRAPSLALAGAIERAFAIPAGAWTRAPSA